MKKILLCLTILCSALVLTACTSEKVTLNLTDLEEKLDNLKGNDFSRISASDMLNATIGNLEFVYDFDFQEKFGINSENIEEYSIEMNNDTMDMYFIVKPVEGKAQEVKTEIENYIDSLEESVKSKLSNEEYQNYLIYIIANDSKTLLEEAKNCKDNIFNNLTTVNEELLSQQFDIEKELIDEYLVKTPMIITSSSSYMIIKPAEGKKEEVKEKINSYMTKLEEQWKTYLVDQYDLVKNRYEKEYGDYLIYIISSDNDLVFDTIKANNLG